MYKPLKVELIGVCGMAAAMKAMRLPKGTVSDTAYTDFGNMGPKDAKLAKALVLAGPDHAKAMRGIIAYLTLEMQVGWMIEFETYRHGVECLSTSSSMHGELAGLQGIELAANKQRDLPAKVYTRIVMVSYQALRAMYRARKNHRHPDWLIFCKFVQGLPYFDTLIGCEKEESMNRAKYTNDLVRTTIVYGPQGCGKCSAANAERLRKQYGCKVIIEDWMDGDTVMKDALHLTIDKPSPYEARGAYEVSYEEASKEW